MDMSTCNQSNTFLFYFDLINEVIWVPCVLIYTLLLLTIFYVYQDSSKSPYRSRFREDYFGYLFFTNIWTLRDIYGSSCRLSLFSDMFKKQLEDPSLKFFLLGYFDVYYDNYDDFEEDKNRYQTMYKNIHFHYRPDFGVGGRNKNSKTQSSIDQNTTLSIRDYVNQRHISSSKKGFSVKNIDEIHPSYICPSCKLVLREPYQLNCKHRLCQSCINSQNNIVSCLICSEISMNNEISLDKDFKDKLECLSIICTICDWTGKLKTYQEHFDQNHLDQFIICSLCFEQIERCKIYEHYRSITHQKLLPSILLHLHSIKMKKDQQEKLVFSPLNNTISVLSNDMIMVQNNLQQLDCDYRSHETSLQVVTHDLLSLRKLSEDNDNDLFIMTSIQDILREDIDLLKQRLDDRQIISFDGTLLWKISDIQQRLNDAKSERQRSIYSPIFYSSPFGYKMCSRLFLNGTNNTHREYLSIYFILMQGDYDALLEWPFCFKVTFSLLDQSTPKNNQNHLRKSFWSDRKSICFQRPRLEMNENYGFDNFISLEQFQQNQNRYIQNDTIFVQIEVDFLNRSPALLSDSAGMLMNDERHTDTIEDESLRKFFQ